MTNNIRKLIQEVLNDGLIMSLGTYDEGGVWVADVVYIHDNDLNLYWTSLQHVRHSKAIEVTDNVACSIRAQETTRDERALQIHGTAEKLDGPFFELEKEIRKKRGLSEPKKPGEILEGGYAWYVLRPERIELIHTKLFGYTKQKLDF